MAQATPEDEISGVADAVFYALAKRSRNSASGSGWLNR